MVLYNNMKIIGRVEPVAFPEVNSKVHFARIDTGAKTSAIWTSSVKLEGQRLAVTFFGPRHKAYDSKKHYFDEYTSTVVVSSNGQSERRYKVKLLVIIGEKRIRASFTLADRSKQVYPILIGRNVLRGKFIVDVMLGSPLIDDEHSQSYKLQNGHN